MILVMEAGYQGWVAFSAASTLPVSASTRIRASARTGDADRVMAVQVIAQAAANAKPNVDGREIIRFAGPDRCYWYKKAEGIPKPPANPPGCADDRPVLYTEDRSKSKTWNGSSRKACSNK